MDRISTYIILANSDNNKLLYGSWEIEDAEAYEGGDWETGNTGNFPLEKLTLLFMLMVMHFHTMTTVIHLHDGANVIHNYLLGIVIHFLVVMSYSSF